MDPRGVVGEVKEAFERRLSLAEGGSWRLRYLHEVGLENFVQEVWERGECKKVVQMPTGAGKSVLMSLLTLATVHLRERVREGSRRNLILTFAPLTRIKLQLLQPLLAVSGAFEGFRGQNVFSVCLISSAEGQLEEVRKELYVKRRIYEKFIGPQGGSSTVVWVSPFFLFSAENVSEALQRLCEKAASRRDHCFIAVLCPHALAHLEALEEKLTLFDFLGNSPKEGLQVETRESMPAPRLKELVLAVFADEAHVMVNPRSELGRSIKSLAEAAPVALGFTATPIRETFLTITGKPPECGESLFLHGEPIYSYDLVMGTKWNRQDGRVLIDSFKAYFYMTNQTILDLTILNGLLDRQERLDEVLWKRVYSEKRVRRYTMLVFKHLEEHFGEHAPRAKVLVLAPNTWEADAWRNVLEEDLRDRNWRDTRVFKAHSRDGEKALGEIDRFVKSSSGFLVAVDMVKLGFDDPDLDALVIARPVENMVAYVQMRGRVLRYPKSQDRPKAHRGALILHLAAKEIMEDEERIRKVESGRCSREAGMFEELSGSSDTKPAVRLDDKLELELIFLGCVPVGPKSVDDEASLNKQLASIESEISYIDYLLSRIERRPDAPHNEGLQVAYRHLKRLRAEKERQRDELIRRLARGRRR